MIKRAGSGCLLLVSELLLKFSMASSFFSFLLLVRGPQFGQIVIRLLDVLLVFLAGVFLDPGHSIKCQPEGHQESLPQFGQAVAPGQEEGRKKEEATEKFKRNSDTSREERKCLCGQEQKRKERFRARFRL